MKNKKKIIPVLWLSALLLMPYLSMAQIVIGEGATVTVSGAATIALSNAGFTNNGTYTKGTETVTFSGSTAKSITGSAATSFNNVTISNSGGITDELSGTLTVNALTVSSTGALTVNSGKTLTTTTFTIESDASGSGSVIVSGTLNGDITYNRYMTGSAWHLVSSPVAGQGVSGFISGSSISTNGGKSGVGTYTESNNTWSLYTDPYAGGDTFTAGKGYEVMRSADGTVAFAGTCGAAVSDFAISRSAEGTNKGWNLVGNPFTSFINCNTNAGATNFLSTNSAALDDSFEALYYWNGSAYATINQSSGATTFTPGQGFFVRSVVGGSNVDFTSGMQSHTTGTFKSAMQLPEIELIAETANKQATAIIRFIPGMTLGLDPGYDAGAFEQNPSFGISTRLVEDNGINFAIQCLPDQEYQQLTIPVVLNAQAGSEVTFKIKGTNLTRLNVIYLEDKLTGRSIRLNDSGNSYSVTLEGSTAGTGRFFITNQLGSSDIVKEKLDPIKVISIPSQNIVRVLGRVTLPAQLMIYDMNGRVLSSVNLTDETVNEVRFNQVTSGIYLIQIRSGKDMIREKINWVR